MEGNAASPMATKAASAASDPTKDTTVASTTRAIEGWLWFRAKSTLARPKDRSRIVSGGKVLLSRFVRTNSK